MADFGSAKSFAENPVLIRESYLSMREGFRNEGMQLLVDGHISHSPEEMRAIYREVIEAGRNSGIPMPRMKAFQDIIDNL